MRAMSGRRAMAALLAVAVLAAACGGGDEGADSAEVGESTAQDETSAAGDGQDAVDEPSAGAAFPVTVTHAFGETTIEAEPQRVLTYGFSDHSYVLSVGVVPIALRKTFDSQPFVVWPWAQDALGGAVPELIAFGEPSFEQIALLEPDVIIAVNANVDERVYGLLSAIAPTVARSAEYDIQGTPWREKMALVGRVLGRPDEADAVVAGLEQRFAEVQEENPAFVDATISVAFHNAASGRLGSYNADNGRYQLMGEIGFVPAPALVGMASEGTVIELGAERIDLLDADVVIWSPADTDRPEDIRNIPTRSASLPAAAEGREVITDLFLAAAMTEFSPLSATYALDRLVPDLAAAIDGDITTPALSAVDLYELGDTYVPTPEEAAAMEAWRVVLSSDATLEERRPHIDDLDTLAPLIADALVAAEAAGGITITPTRAQIVGDEATVTFDAALGPAVTTDLVAGLDLVDGRWVARRQEICVYIGFVGVQCPD